MNEAIEVREVGNYRISIYPDLNGSCPCTDWDMAACYLWEYGNCHLLSGHCNWQDIYGIYGNPKHSLEDALRELVSENIDFEDLFEYFKNGKVSGYRLRHEEDMWYFEKYNYSKDNRYKGYHYLFFFYDSDIENGYDMTDEFIEDLEYDDLIQILNDLGKDIVVKKWSTRGYSQGDYVEGIAYCTKNRYKKMCCNNIDGWKEKVSQMIDDEVGAIGMWMWGDVKGFVLEQKENYVKFFKDSDKEPEEGCEWKEIDSAWGYYMETDELIEEVIAEYGLKENNK